MDYMVTGRPIVATAVPECRHYRELFHVAEDEGEFIAAVRSILDAGSDDGRAARRHEWARANTCRLAADQVDRLAAGLTAATSPGKAVASRPDRGYIR